MYARWKGGRCLVHRGTNSGGASRFFYTAKASWSGRGEDNHHPTVKPQSLVSYLVKLVSRPGDIVFDPFAGSGTMPRVADKLGRRGIGLELKPDYCRMGKNRCFDDAPLLSAGLNHQQN